MKILVTGAAGMLASELVPKLKSEGIEVTGYDINQRMPGIRQLDITHFMEVMKAVEETNPDYIFHLAAETDIDRCEKDPNHAFRVNTIGTENIALACRKLGIKFLYISTAGVFGGDKPHGFTEFDTPDPLNIYGASKLQGELSVRYLLNEYFIIRAGWMVGGWEIDKKFVYKIIQQLKNGQTQLKAVADKFGSPTFAKDLAENLIVLLKTGRYGLYHMVNKGSASRYDIALKIVEFMGLKNMVDVRAVSSDHFPLPAPRACSEILLNYKLDLIGLNLMPHWEKSLEEYIQLNKCSGKNI